MPNASEAIAIAIGHHRAGRLHEAEKIYREILARDPSCADAWNLLGVMASHAGQYEHAATLAGQAVQLRPGFAEFQYSLGFALHGQGNLDAAAASYLRVLEIDCNHIRALNNLGTLLHLQGNLAEAVSYHRRARDLNPGSADAHFNLANDLKALENWDEAIACYLRALELNPQWGEAHSNLGDALQGRGDLHGAVKAYCQARSLLPNSPHVHSNLGSAWERLGDFDQAIACYRLAVELAPHFVEARLNLGAALHTQGDLSAAEQHIRHALGLNPNNHQALNSLGLLLRDEGRLDEAWQCFQRSIELKPDYAEAHTNRAMLRLAAGDLEQGWPEYEWRWKTKESVTRRFDQPLWDGLPLNGKSILLHAEQGLGDTLQFIRYAALVRQLGATVIVECQQPLARLLAGCKGIDQLIAQDEPLPPFDVHAPLLSVPGLLRTTLSSVTADVPYLAADPQLVTLWRDKLAALEGFRIGINWRGRAGQGMFRRRDIPLECFAPLAHGPVSLVSLQKDARPQELGVVDRPIYHPGDDFDRTHGPFMDTAAIMMNLDLVITSDTSTPHLAGALGRPVWVALPYVASWQWMRDRADSPWYPNTRLFRQKSPGGWSGVFDEIRSELSKLLFAAKN